MKFGVPTERERGRKRIMQSSSNKLLALIGGQGTLSTSGRFRVYLAWLTDY
jgi:hypothetical protein